jgi:GAF domain-containing protein
LFVLWLVHTGRSQPAGWLVLAVVVLANFAQVIEAGLTQPMPLSPGNILLLVVPLVVAATLTGTRGFLLIFALSVLSLIWLGSRQAGVTSFIPVVPSRLVPEALAEIAVSLVIIGFAMSLYIRGTRRVLTEGVTEIGQWHKVADINTQLAPIETEPEAIRALLNAVRDNLGYTAGWLYLVNREGEFTRLLRMNLGKLDVVEGDALVIPAGSTMTEAVKNRQPEPASPDDLPGRRRHWLPTTRASLSVPVIYQDELLGVLDVQHKQSLRPDDVETVRHIGVALGTALGRIRLLTDLRQSLREQEQAAGQVRGQLSELRQREGVGVSTAWSRYMSGRGRQAIGFDLESQGMSLTPASDLPASLVEALGQGKIHVQATPEGHTINVPIRFREQTLGAMSFTLPPGQQPAQRQLDMATTVAERLALALENTRLLEQTQAQAQRERTASTVAARLLGQTDVRRLLDDAAASFTESLNAVHTRIYLQPGMLIEGTPAHTPAEVPAL